jgi:hypothetical protein
MSTKKSIAFAVSGLALAGVLFGAAEASNMGFKLNLVSVPAGGTLPVEDPNGGTWELNWAGDSLNGFTLTLVPAP